MRRFFVEPKALNHSTAALTGSDAKHIRTVLRLKPGARIILFDGTGRECRAAITDMTPDAVTVRIFESSTSLTESPVRITLAQGFLKDKKMDGLVRGITELGIHRWMPFFAARSVPRPSAERLRTRTERWRKIALEALKQCRRGCAPEILSPVTFQEALDFGAAGDMKIVFWEKALEPIPVLCSGPAENHYNSVTVLLGPEGGLTDQEVAAARAVGFLPVTLGPRILRAETATLAACSLVQYLFGDLSGAVQKTHE